VYVHQCLLDEKVETLRLEFLRCVSYLIQVADIPPESEQALHDEFDCKAGESATPCLNLHSVSIPTF